MPHLSALHGGLPISTFAVIIEANDPKRTFCAGTAMVIDTAQVASLELSRHKLLAPIVRNFDCAFRFVCDPLEIIFYRMIFQVRERNRPPELAY
jgi:hypothetical protein